ncbi:lamin tail domain-containing protein [Roseimarinus sediminis]|uniref:lamin tail domain-containing protein n=1 Tax=Roseimarinus sediminis TaxID=1610899 RepID=UPI003D2451C6
MRHFIRISLVIFTITLSKALVGQVIWSEDFELPGKGTWVDSTGKLQSDFSEVDWSLNTDECNFADENDYAKSVPVDGGRFELIDSDGEALWYSPVIDISTYAAVNILVHCGETGSNTNVEKKYIKAAYRTDDDRILPFNTDSTAAGNWGNSTLLARNIQGESLQIMLRMNASYANDKVYIRQIEVEVYDSLLSAPSQLILLKQPFYGFTGDSIQLTAAVINDYGEMISGQQFEPLFESGELQVLRQTSDGSRYFFTLLPKRAGIQHFSISEAKGKLRPVADSLFLFSKQAVLLNEDFENELSGQWNFDGWNLSDDQPIEGKQSARSLEKDSSGTSGLGYTMNPLLLSEAVHLFAFQIKNGNWDPSSSNAFYMVFEDEQQEHGLAIGVNAAGSSDLLSVWTTLNGAADELLAESNYDWDANETCHITLIITPRGNCLLGLESRLTGKQAAVHFVNPGLEQISSMQLYFKHTATRSGLLWLDSMLVAAHNSAPFLLDVQAVETGIFKLHFNEAINTSALTTQHFEIAGKSGQLYNVDSIKIESAQAILLYCAPMAELYLSASAFSITDLQGQSTEKSSLSFINVMDAGKHDLVLSEIMADPYPPVGLPNVEYIEVFNRSSKNINLSTIQLRVDDKNYPLIDTVLYPGAYALLCPDETATSFPNAGTILPLEHFPTLKNAGSTIILRCNNDTIDGITYDERWYHYEEKAKGGYSLERIDPERFCGQYGNWQASGSAVGGSPGKVNTLWKNHPDLDPPVLTESDLFTDTSILLLYNEPLDRLLAQNIHSYSLSTLSVRQAIYRDDRFGILLILDQPLSFDRLYQLTIKGIADECGNLSLSKEITLARPQLKAGTVLINELLFNPFPDGADFVELVNNTAFPIDLADLKLATRDDSLKLKSIFPLSEKHLSFLPDSILAFTTDTAAILSAYRVVHREALRFVERMPAFNNDAGRVLVLNDSLEVIDELIYDEDMHSSWLSDREGVSIERLALTAPTNERGNWQSASSLNEYATPGHANSQSKNEEAEADLLTFESDVVTPNGDGYHDELIIELHLTKSDYLVNLFVFDTHGREVKRLLNNELSGSNNQLHYDVSNHQGNKLSTGIYVLFAEVLHSEGYSRHFKKAFLVSGTK